MEVNPHFLCLQFLSNFLAPLDCYPSPPTATVSIFHRDFPFEVCWEKENGKLIEGLRWEELLVMLVDFLVSLIFFFLVFNFCSAKSCVHLITTPLILQYRFLIGILPVLGVGREAAGSAEMGGASGDCDGGCQLVTLADAGCQLVTLGDGGCLTGGRDWVLVQVTTLPEGFHWSTYHSYISLNVIF